jgi:hypothetical protein
LKEALSIVDMEKFELTALLPTTFTISGYFSGLAFDSAKDAHLFALKNAEQCHVSIYGVESNFYREYDPCYTPKVKAPPKHPVRRAQGSGITLNGLISFILPSDLDDSGYVVHVFPNGKYEIPGALRGNVKSAKLAIESLACFLSKCTGSVVAVDAFTHAMCDFKQMMLPASLAHRDNGTAFDHYDKHNSASTDNYIIRLPMLTDLVNKVGPPARSAYHDYDKARTFACFDAGDGRKICVNMFASGKFIFLGAPSYSAALVVSQCIKKIFDDNPSLITVKGPPDAVRR